MGDIWQIYLEIFGNTPGDALVPPIIFMSFVQPQNLLSLICLFNIVSKDNATVRKILII